MPATSALLHDLHRDAREAVQMSSTSYATAERLVRLGARLALLRALQHTTRETEGKDIVPATILLDMMRELDR